MSETPRRRWHVARWPALAWLETVLKLAALTLGVAAGIQALMDPAFGLASGWRLAQLVLLALLSLGLVGAIVDRWADREVIAMIFVIINNLGHWGMVLRLASAQEATDMLLPFAGLMLLGDLVKLAFIRVHGFTVRDFTSAVLIRLTSAYVVGYLALFLIGLLGGST